MEPVLELCEQTLKAQLVACRLAKNALIAEITAPTASQDQRQEAVIRYAEVVSEIRTIANRLEMFERLC
jgi:hypothetical protein